MEKQCLCSKELNEISSSFDLLNSNIEYLYTILTMFTSVNRTIFEIPLTWNRTHFELSRVKYRQARRLIEISINSNERQKEKYKFIVLLSLNIALLYLAQLNKELKNVFFQKLEIEKDITESQEDLLKHERKIRVLDNLADAVSQSLSVYFDKVSNLSFVSLNLLYYS